MLKLDKKDYRILFELDRNCRQSINELSRKTRLSRDVVRYRIKRLEEKKILEQYITLIDYGKLDYTLVRLYLKLQNTTAKIEEEIMKEILSQEKLFTAYRTDGKYEFALAFLVKDMNEYQRAYDAIFQKYRKYIIEKSVSVFLNFVHYYRNYLVDTDRDFTEITVKGKCVSDFDDIDVLILKELSENARIPVLELAKKLKLSSTAITYRIRNLEKKKIIMAYRATINHHKLGYQYFKVDLILEDLSIIPALHEHITRHPNILYRDVAVGGTDFEFDCELRNQEEFYELIEEIRTLFPGKIREFFYYKAIKIYKFMYFPEDLKRK